MAVLMVPQAIGSSLMATSRRTLLRGTVALSGIGTTGCLDSLFTGSTGRFQEEWVSETAVAYDGNHHGLAVAQTAQGPRIGIPRSGPVGTQACAVLAVDGAGAQQWIQPLPRDRCGVHAIGDLSVGDPATDERPCFLAMVNPGTLVGYDAATGEETISQSLSADIGYSEPVVARLGDAGRVIVAVDFVGQLSVVAPDGTVQWSADLRQPVFVRPLIANFTRHDAPNVAVRHGRTDHEIVCFTAAGEVAWRRNVERGSQSWAIVGPADEPDILVSMGGSVARITGTDGTIAWERTVDPGLRDIRLGAITGGTAVAGADDGVARGLDLATGTIDWSTRIAGDGTRLPAPARGAVSAPEDVNVVLTAHDGTVAVLDEESGTRLARTQRGTGVYTPPRTVDLTGDGRDEIAVLHGDGRVAALSIQSD